MDWRKILEYLGALTSNSILPSFKGFFSASSGEISDSIKRVEKAIKDESAEAVEEIKKDLKDGVDKIRRAKLAGEGAKFLNKMEFVKGEKGDKGDKGDKPSKEEILEIVEPLIPEAIPGKDGHNPLTVSKKQPSNPTEGDLWYQP